MYCEIIHSIQYNSNNNYFDKLFSANRRSLLKYIANKKYQVFSQAPQTFYRVRSWLSMAVVALTRVQRVEGIEPKRASERAGKASLVVVVVAASSSRVTRCVSMFRRTSITNRHIR